MGLLLLIPGLVLLFNGTTWFNGEDNVGMILVVVGAIILLLQVLWMLFVGSKARRIHKDVNRSFQSNSFHGRGRRSDWL